jgi:hypothetical protein
MKISFIVRALVVFGVEIGVSFWYDFGGLVAMLRGD